MDYMTIKEASEKWGVGTRVITVYCAEGMIAGAVKRGNLWLLPKTADKPKDKRRKALPEQAQIGTSDICNPTSLYEKKELFAEIVKYLPYPMHICSPEGIMLFANDEYLKFAKITNTEKIYGKHNILKNPNLERWGIKDFVERAFLGEAVSLRDIKVPHKEIVERLGDHGELVYGSMYHDMTALPIKSEDGTLLYVAFIFIISRSYQDKAEIIRGKEYIDANWKEEFDIDKLANAVFVSAYHYIRLFKQHTGMTPYKYYQEIKIKKLKEKLDDKNLTIVAAFAECGVDYGGNWSKIFKQKTNMSPSEYRSKQ